MTIQELMRLQREFDHSHESEFRWDGSITQENLDMLEFLLIALMGELGETSNIVKKIVRGDFTLDEKKSNLSEEIVDMFIYLIKLAYQLDIDLEQVYTEKMTKNHDRFKNYEKGSASEAPIPRE